MGGVGGVGGFVAHKILVSAQGPLVFGIWVWGLGVWGPGLTIFQLFESDCRILNDLSHLTKWILFFKCNRLENCTREMR